jgi:hypothetical protein
MTKKTVTIETSEVGASFGTCAVIRDARTGRKLAETATTRPLGYTAAAYRDGEALAEARGWVVVEGGD